MAHRETTAVAEQSPPPSPGGGSTIKATMWSNRWVGFAAAIAASAGFALASAWLIPRGPVTTGDALVAMVAALVVGLVAGFATGSRWSLLLAPLVFGIVFELARINVDGPTVDGVHLGSILGVVALVVGRLTHGVLVVAPMLLGTAYGLWAASRMGRGTTLRAFAWTLTGVLTALVVVLAVFIAMPASTAPILGPDGEVVPGSVAELITVPIGGHEQALMIRGRSADNPVLLYLTGGPGGTDIGAMRADTGLEQEFVVVTWDQRGSGKSYSALDPVETLTLDRLVSDTIEVTNYLRDRFDQEKIFVVGNSWGATLGVLAVDRDPELYHALVGVGQMVSQRETDVMFWEDTLAWAERTGRNGLEETLTRNGPPPYDDVRNYEHATSYEHDWNPYPEFDPGNEMPAILFVPEYSWMDRINAFKGFFDSASVIYPQLQEIDFRIDVPRLDVPFYMVTGEHEARGRAVLAEEWFAMLDAPLKEAFIFEGSGHRPHFDRPSEFAELMGQVLEQSSASAAEESSS